VRWKWWRFVVGEVVRGFWWFPCPLEALLSFSYYLAALAVDRRRTKAPRVLGGASVLLQILESGLLLSGLF
jgi:hypothetical protein